MVAETPSPNGVDQRMEAGELLIDRCLPVFDFARVEQAIVAAEPPRVFAVARRFDLREVRSPYVRSTLWLRSVPRRFGRWNRAEPRLARHGPMTIDELIRTGDAPLAESWVALGEEPDQAFVIGAVGTLWKPEIRWKQVEPREFTGFDEPGWGKMAVGFSVAPYGESGSTLTYEARTRLTDTAARRRFRRHWYVAGPIVGGILRRTLATVSDRAVTDAGAGDLP